MALVLVLLTVGLTVLAPAADQPVTAPLVPALKVPRGQSPAIHPRKI